MENSSRYGFYMVSVLSSGVNRSVNIDLFTYLRSGNCKHYMGLGLASSTACTVSKSFKILEMGNIMFLFIQRLVKEATVIKRIPLEGHLDNKNCHSNIYIVC